MSDRYIADEFREQILSDFPGSDDFVAKRLAELTAQNFGAHRSSHEIQDWRNEFFLLAQIRYELEQERRKKATTSATAAYSPAKEIPIEPEDPVSDLDNGNPTTDEHGNLLSERSPRSNERIAAPSAGMTPAVNKGGHNR